jgi:hypothetical protein
MRWYGPAPVLMPRAIPANTIPCRTTGFGNRSHYKQSHEMIKRSMYSYKSGIPRINHICGGLDAGTTTGILAPPMRYADVFASALINLDHIAQISS